MTTIIATIIAILSLIGSWILGHSKAKKEHDMEKRVAEAEARAKAHEIETTSARKASEVVSLVLQSEAERSLSDKEISERLYFAETDEEIFKLAGDMARRALERINKR